MTSDSAGAEQESQKLTAIKNAATWVMNAMSEMQAALKEGDIQRISICNDRIAKQANSAKNELRRLAGFNLGD